MSNTSELQRRLDSDLIDAATIGDPEAISRLLSQGANPSAAWFEALREAVKNQHVACVKLLAPLSAETGCALALRIAADQGLSACVKVLIPFCDPMADGFQALADAAKSGHAECVELLLPVSDSRVQAAQALRWAALAGHASCVALLIPSCDPKARASEALRAAAECGHAACVKMLLPVSESPLDNPCIVTQALAGGCAEVFSLMLLHEPGLASSLDLPHIQNSARKEGFHALGDFVASFLEARELSLSTPGSFPEPGKSPRL